MQARYSEEWTDRVRHLGRTVVREPFQRRTWAELGYFLLSSALTYATVVTLGATGLGGVILTAVFVGALVLGGALRLARFFGRSELALVHFVLGEDIPPPAAFAPRPGFFGWIRSALTDRAAWRSVAYFAAKIPLTIFGAWFALSCWIESISSLLAFLAGGNAVSGFGFFARVFGPRYGNGNLHGVGQRWTLLVVGIIFFFIAPWAMRLVVTLDLRMVRALLGPDAASSRVRTLEVSRARTVDAAAATLRRIERDLHDGTQAQLVALAMRLGQAKDKLDRLDGGSTGPDDLEAIRRLVDQAHAGAKEAIGDLRDLARGIHPPALDTGLENALTTLAARSPIATEVEVQVTERPAQAIEAIAYFCAAELLANVAQHAEATRATLTCAQHGPWLRIAVRDNGKGGATVPGHGGRSSGLAGLSDRVAAVDGHLSIASPPGGPTVVTVDVPVDGGSGE